MIEKIAIFSSEFQKSCFMENHQIDDYSEIKTVDDIIEEFKKEKTICEIERISVLTSMIKKFMNSCDISLCLTLAFELACIIDELNSSGILPENFESEFINSFPEHWKKRTFFLKIATSYLPEILSEKGLSDITLAKNNSIKNFCIHAKNKHITYFCSKFDYVKQIKNISNEVVFQDDFVFNIKNAENTTIFAASDIFQEIEYISSVISENPNKTITVSVLNSEFAEILQERLSQKNIKFSSYFETFPQYIKEILLNAHKISHDDEKYSLSYITNKLFMQKEVPQFINDIREYSKDFPEIRISEYSKVLKIFTRLLKNKKNYTEKIKIIHERDLKFSESDIIIITSMNQEDTQYQNVGEYWLHASLRKKLNLTDSDFYKKVFEHNFHSVFFKKSKIFITRHKNKKNELCTKSSVLSKLEILCKKNKVNLIQDKYSLSASKYLFQQEKIKHSEIFIKSDKLTAKDIQLFCESEYDFFIKKILKLQPKFYESEKNTAYKLCRCVLQNCLENENYESQDKIPGAIALKETDLFLYEKFKNTFQKLGNFSSTPLKRLIRPSGKIYLKIENKEIEISDTIDIIDIFPKKNILYLYRINNEWKKNEIRPLISCLIAHKQGFSDIPLNETELWLLNFTGIENKEIECETINITDELIEYSENKTIQILTEYLSSNDFYKDESKNDVYKLFKRSA